MYADETKAFALAGRPTNEPKSESLLPAAIGRLHGIMEVLGETNSNLSNMVERVLGEGSTGTAQAAGARPSPTGMAGQLLDVIDTLASMALEARSRSAALNVRL